MTEKPTYEELIQENEILRQKLINKDLENAHLIEKVVNTAPIFFCIYDIEKRRKSPLRKGVFK